MWHRWGAQLVADGGQEPRLGQIGHLGLLAQRHRGGQFALPAFEPAVEQRETGQQRS